MPGLFTGLAFDRACLRRALEQRIRLIQQLEEFLSGFSNATFHPPARQSIDRG